MGSQPLNTYHHTKLKVLKTYYCLYVYDIHKQDPIRKKKETHEEDREFKIYFLF